MSKQPKYLFLPIKAIASDSRIDSDQDQVMILLSDYTYWGHPKINKALEKWCDEYGAVLDGLTLVFPDDETFLLFKMTWV